MTDFLPQNASEVERVAHPLIDWVSPTHAVVNGDFRRITDPTDPNISMICPNPADRDVGDVQLGVYHVRPNYVTIHAPLRYLMHKRPDGVPEPTIVVTSPDGGYGYALWRVSGDTFDNDAVASDLALRVRGQIVQEHWYIPAATPVLHYRPEATYNRVETNLLLTTDVKVIDFELDQLRGRVGENIMEAIVREPVTGRRVTVNQTDLTRSGQYFSVMIALVGADLSDDEIFTIFSKEAIGIPLREHGRSFQKDFIRELNNAKSKIAARGGAVKLERGPLTDVSAKDLFPLPSPVPKLRWLFEDLALSGVVTLVIGKGGEGKSLFTLQAAVAAAACKRFAYWEPKKRSRVLYINIEDDLLHVQRRLVAICKHMDIDPEDLCGYFDRLDAMDIALVEKTNDDIHRTAFFKALMNKLVDYDLLVIDPLIECHKNLDENSNADMKEIILAIRVLALAARIPVICVHHARKNSTSGDQDSARGGSAIVNAARIAKTMERMTDEEWERIRPSGGAEPKERFVRVTDAKQNYAGRIGDRWLRLVPVDLGNGETAPAFEEVAFGMLDLASWDRTAEAIELVRSGQPSGEPWNVAAQAKRATRLDVALCDKFGLDVADAGKLIESLLSEGRIAVLEVKDPKGKVKKVWVVTDEKPRVGQDEIPF